MVFYKNRVGNKCEKQNKLRLLKTRFFKKTLETSPHFAVGRVFERTCDSVFKCYITSNIETKALKDMFLACLVLTAEMSLIANETPARPFFITEQGTLMKIVSLFSQAYYRCEKLRVETKILVATNANVINVRTLRLMLGS